MVLVLVGLIAGLASGLFGVGGGIVMVPLLVIAMRVRQHEAHATSLAAIVPIALVGAITFALGDQIHVGLAALLALGALAGAPLGARIMARLPERELKTAFGLLSVAVGVPLLWS